jgi:hypothetical protein
MSAEKTVTLPAVFTPPARHTPEMATKVARVKNPIQELHKLTNEKHYFPFSFGQTVWN